MFLEDERSANVGEMHVVPNIKRKMDMTKPRRRADVTSE
jgi:hypothetical protein